MDFGEIFRANFFLNIFRCFLGKSENLGTFVLLNILLHNPKNIWLNNTCFVLYNYLDELLERLNIPKCFSKIGEPGDLCSPKYSITQSQKHLAKQYLLCVMQLLGWFIRTPKYS